MDMQAANNSEEQDLLYQENQEVSIGENPTWVERIMAAFPAFESRNYRLYFSGQLISLIGTWLQIVAEGWLVLQLTNSPLLIGLVTALATLPSLLFSLFGGVIVDKFPKKKILLFTQYASMILALLYGSLTVLHFITIYEIMTLAFLLGIVNALDIPARQAFVVDLVGKEALGSAIALNSGVFNAARVVGPSIAGILIALVGSGGAFLLNGVSYIAAIIVLYLMHVESRPSMLHGNPMKAIRDGVSYAFAHPIIRMLLIFTGVVSIFGWSYSTIMPYIAKQTFGMNAEGLGYLYAASGLGALVGTFFISAFAKKISGTVFIIGGSLLFCVSLVLFTLTHVVIIAYVLLFFAGVGLLSQFATINTTIQHMVEDNMRGRVMALYSLMFLGLAPLGNFEIGYLSEHFGTGIAIQVGLFFVFVFTLFVFFSRNRTRAKQEAYTEANS